MPEIKKNNKPPDNQASTNPFVKFEAYLIA